MKKIIIWVLIVIVFILGIFLLVKKYQKPGPYDEFAVCLEESGAKFYGTFWCPYCQAQKKDFGKSAKLLPYVECSTADGKGQKQICTDAKIEGYPTWIFKDESRAQGKLSFETLSEKTSCPLPIEENI